ncbi:choice-of-anchor Q domain-containing protein [Lacipirellula sp.]|uniref:choice-of-anchor Q domain-containing protein n=1 Tax=Lacipirellula sp. TaxID=2691419 RepID=UPI003D13CEB0
MAKLGLKRVRTSSRVAKRLTSAQLGYEILEDRRVLTSSAVGSWIRMDASISGKDLETEIYTGAEAANAPNDNEPVDDQQDNLLRKYSDSLADGDGYGYAFAKIAGFIIPEIWDGASPVTGANRIAVPSVTMESVQVGSANQGGEGSAGGNVSMPYGEIDGRFKFDDSNPSVAKKFYGALYLIGLGEAMAGGYDSGARLDQRASITIGLNGDAIGTITFQHYTDIKHTDLEEYDETSGLLTVDIEGQEPYTVATTGANIYVNFVVDIENGNEITMSGRLEDSTHGPGIGAGFASNTANGASSSSYNFIKNVHAYGFAFEAENPPDDLPPIWDGGGDGDGNGITNSNPRLFEDGEAPGDVNGDGVVDELDALLWRQNVAAAIQNDVAPLIVTTEEDVDDGDYSFHDLSLREALSLASDSSYDGARIIAFAKWIDHITLDGTQLVVDSDANIVGPGAGRLTIDGDGLSRIFSIVPGADATISGLTVTGGGNVSTGGGILNNGVLTLESVVVSGNTTTSSGYGGGILTQNGLTGTARLYLRNSTVDGNHASFGSGLYLSVDDGEVEITGSTISNNVALGLATSTYSAGGGICADSTNTASIEITNSTFSGNHALYSGGIRLQNSLASFSLINSTIAYNIGNDAGGLHRLNNTSDPVLHNTIVSENTAHSTSTKLDILGSVDLTNSTYNLIGSGGAGGLSNTNGNIILSSPNTAGLAPLGDYGGKTKTHALKTTSPAIDKGSNDYTTTYDQRGVGFTGEYDLPNGTYPNGADGARDIGAYEASTGTTLIVRSDDDRDNSVDLKATTDSLRLREALALSAALVGSETITFDQSGWADDEIQLSSTWGYLSVTSEVKIEGPGADKLTVAAAPSSRVMYVSPTATSSVISGMRITGGATPFNGGGVYVASPSATIDRVQIDENSASDGAGIYVASGGGLTLRNSTLWRNEATYYGGGLAAYGTADVTIVNSTIAENEAGIGGGIHAYGGTDVRVVNATIAYNIASDKGGGVNAASSSTVRLDNTIVAGNEDTFGAPDIFGIFSGASVHNLIGIDYDDENGIDHGDTNLVGVEGANPALEGGLSEVTTVNGLKVYQLLSDSLAIDHGDDDFATTFDYAFDQIGNDRIVDYDGIGTDHIDAGATELQLVEV